MHNQSQSDRFTTQPKGKAGRLEPLFVAAWIGLSRFSRRTLACYPAAISPEPGNTTGRRRGGIAGRWTKPVAATQLVASRQKPICPGEGNLGIYIAA